MNKAVITIDVNGKIYTDSFFYKNQQPLKEALQKAASGELDVLTFSSGNKEYYFPKKILSEAIITVTYDNEVENTSTPDPATD